MAGVKEHLGLLAEIDPAEFVLTRAHGSPFELSTADDARRSFSEDDPARLDLLHSSAQRRGEQRTKRFRSTMGAGRVQRHGRANESPQCLLVNLLALVEVDGTPGVAIEAGVEEG